MINRRLEEGEDFRWIVPVDYVTNLVDFRDSFILNKTSSKYSIERSKYKLRNSQNSIFILAYEVEFPADVTWFKANLNNTGFYRVNYPPHIWDGLTNQLLREHTIFSTADRAQLLNDAFSLSM